MRKYVIFFLLLQISLSCIDDNTYNANKVPVQLLNEAELEQLINNRESKSLFINVWATWCTPCREEFPDLIKLSEKYFNQDIDIVGISVDYPDEVDSKVIPFLNNQKVNFTNYVQNFQKQENLINRLNKNWNGALPATFIFNQKGKLISYLPGKHQLNNFVLEIEKVLISSSSI